MMILIYISFLTDEKYYLDQDEDMGMNTIIYGAGQNGRIVLDILKSQNNYCYLPVGKLYYCPFDQEMI